MLLSLSVYVVRGVDLCLSSCVHPPVYVFHVLLQDLFTFQRSMPEADLEDVEAITGGRQSNLKAKTVLDK